MANAAYNIDIGLQADGLIAASKRIEERLGAIRAELAKLPEGSKKVGGLTREINSLNAALQRNQKLQSNLGQKIVPDISQPSAKLVDSSKQARIALTSLSLVAQDLPFGFIGIQNNLPGVISSFSNLSAGANGVKGALSAIVTSLKGPAGLFLAFSAVTAAVTFAVQKYGSLGEAYKALVASGKVLSKEQKEIAAGVAEEGTKVITLFALYSNLEGSRSKQIQILKKLNEVSPEYFGNLDAEKTKIDQLKQSIDKYIDSFIGKIFVETQQKKITELLTKYAEKITAIIDKEIDLDKKRKKSVNDFVKQQELIAKTQQQGLDLPINIVPTNIKKTTEEVIKDLKGELIGQIQSVFGQTDIFKQFINISDAFGAPKKGGKSVGLFDWPTDMRYQMSELEKYQSFLKANIYFQVTSIRKLLTERAKLRKELNVKGDFGPAMALAPSQIGVPPIAGISAERRDEIKRLAELNLAGKETQKTFQNVYNLLNESFFTPITNLFSSFLDTGKFAFKEFGNAILASIKALVSKIIATGILALLATILVPGGGIIAGGAASGIAGGAGRFGRNFLSLLGFGNVASPSFAGVGGGQLGFGGSVSLTLRGSDLVGALNRTNTTISRVG